MQFSCGIDVCFGEMSNLTVEIYQADIVQDCSHISGAIGLFQDSFDAMLSSHKCTLLNLELGGTWTLNTDAGNSVLISPSTKAMSCKVTGEFALHWTIFDVLVYRL